MYSPNSEVKLLNTPLSIDGEHQIVFSSKSEQASYFDSCSHQLFNNFTFIKKDNILKIPANIETLYQYNYVMYKNTQFSGKYFYAYIVDMKWLSDNTTEVTIKTDVFQTWYFDLTFKQSFIDRQTPITDDYNTIADTPAHGQLVEVANYTYSFSGGYFVFCSCDVTQDVTTDSQPYSFTIGGYNIPCWVLYWDESESAAMSTCLQRIASHGWGDRILSAVYVPYIANKGNFILTDYNSTSIGDIKICTGFTNGVDSMAGTITFDFTQSAPFKKALTYPYAKIVVQDMTTGQSVELSPEKFSGTSAQFQVVGTISETPTYRVTPKNYDGQELAYGESLVTKCSTTLPIANNLYAKYMMMNGEINNMNKAFAGVDALGAVASKNVGALVSPIEKVISITAQENQASKLGNSVTTITDGAMDRINFYNGIKVTLYMMDNNHKDMCNNFWKMYGYPVHSLGTPNITGGTGNFNFVKMVNPNIEGGNVPQGDMSQIEEMFSRGVTLWKGSANYRNY
jgi:hypothetical protein